MRSGRQIRRMRLALAQTNMTVGDLPGNIERILCNMRRAAQATDSLPPYYILDPILRAYVEEDRDVVEIVELGYEPEVVKRVVALVDRSEYKRRQAPPGIKITERAFGRDRRLPVTNAYTGEPAPYVPCTTT